MIEIAAGLFDSEAWLLSAGTWALALVCVIVFVETGLLIGFLLPGDTLLIVTGVLTFTGTIPQPIWLVCLCIFVAAFVGDQLGYWIGLRGGPAVFERKESGFFSRKSVARTEQFFERWGGWAISLARFVPFVRTFAPVAAGIGRMDHARFSFFNAIGAVAWGIGLPLFGWGIAHVPWIAQMVTDYAEIVILSVVGLAAITALVHYLKMRRDARQQQAEDAQLAASEAPIADEPAGAVLPGLDLASPLELGSPAGPAIAEA